MDIGSRLAELELKCRVRLSSAQEEWSQKNDDVIVILGILDMLRSMLGTDVHGIAQLVHTHVGPADNEQAEITEELIMFLKSLTDEGLRNKLGEYDASFLGKLHQTEDFKRNREVSASLNRKRAHRSEKRIQKKAEIKTTMILELVRSIAGGSASLSNVLYHCICFLVFFLFDVPEDWIVSMPDVGGLIVGHASMDLTGGNAAQMNIDVNMELEEPNQEANDYYVAEDGGIQGDEERALFQLIEEVMNEQQDEEHLSVLQRDNIRKQENGDQFMLNMAVIYLDSYAQ